MRGDKTGRIEYTGRALLQDAQEAMGGDIVRGLVELITNADDAYERKEAERGKKIKQAKILVEVEHRRGNPWRVVVRDRAAGMSHDELDERICKIGTRTSGFEAGLNVRGNRGRGAKDLVAFGEVTFKTIKANQYSTVALRQDGTYTLSQSRKATASTRTELGIPRGDGTVVEITCLPSIRCPQHGNLKSQLQSHFQLRDIMSDTSRDLMLVNLNRTTQRERLHYGIDYDSLEEVLDQSIAIRGYPEASARLQIWRLRERSEQPRSDPTRPNGVLITGCRAIYDNTLSGFEGNRHSGWFTGRLHCPYIDKLAKDFDDLAEEGTEPPDNNPLPIISRRRDGLAPDHPFTKSIHASLDSILQGLIEAEEERERDDGRQIENESTRKRLHRMAREVARFLQEALREIEIDELPMGGPGDVEPLRIVPPEVVVHLGDERVLSVIARAEGVDENEKVSLVVEPEGVIDLIGGRQIKLGPHRKREDVLTAQIQVRPLVEGMVLINATLSDREAVALLSIKPAIEDEPEEADELPETLEFEKPRYRIRWGKRKKLTLRAPSTLVKEYGDVANVFSDQPGIVVLGGGHIRLRPSAQADVVEGVCQVEGRELGAKGTLSARLNDVSAECRVSVEQRDEGLPDLKIQLTQKEPSIYRALFDPPEVDPGEQQTLLVFARHASLNRYLGEAPDFPGQDQPEWKAVLAEVVTEAVVRRIITLKYPTGQEGIDADQIYYDHFTFSGRLLPLMQRVVAVG